MKNKILLTAIICTLVSCAYFDDITQSINDETNISDSKGSDAAEELVISGESSVQETFIATSETPQYPSKWATNNYGESGWMQVGYYDDSSHMRGLVSFDVTADEMENVSNVTLELTSQWWMRKHNSGKVTIELYPMITEWNEGQSGNHEDHSVRKGVYNSSIVDGATAEESSYGSPWIQPFVGLGNDALSEPIAVDTHSPEESDTIVWSFDITGISQNQLSRGFLIVLKEDTSKDGFYDYPVFYTTESDRGDEHGPRLRLNY